MMYSKLYDFINKKSHQYLLMAFRLILFYNYLTSISIFKKIRNHHI